MKPRNEQGGESFFVFAERQNRSSSATIPSRLPLFLLVCSPIQKQNVVPPLQVEEPERWSCRGCGGCCARNRCSSSRDEGCCRRCRRGQWQRQDCRRRRLGHLRAGDGLAPAAVSFSVALDFEEDTRSYRCDGGIDECCRGDVETPGRSSSSASAFIGLDLRRRHDDACRPFFCFNSMQRALCCPSAPSPNRACLSAEG